MSDQDLRTALAAFARADAAAWPGLPVPALLSEVTAVWDVDTRRPRAAEAGDPAQPGTWFAAASDRYAGGLRVWCRDDVVVAVEGIHPLDEQDEFEPAPDLGEPDLRLPTLLGPLLLGDGELVYAGRGLAVRTNPANGLLLGLVGFAPTTPERYVADVRPVQVAPEPWPVSR